MARTIAEDRILAVKIAEGLGHEIGSWGWWFGQRRGIAHCKLCNDWVGIYGGVRNWNYDPDWTWMNNSGIGGSAIIDRYKWRKKKCIGIKYRAKQRAKWTKKYNQMVLLLLHNTSMPGWEVRKTAKVIVEVTWGKKP